MIQLLEHAASIGCRVYFLPLPDDWEGYFAEGNVLVVNACMTEVYQREVLAHELGHIHYGHDLRTRHDTPTDERRADRYAARLLISPSEYALAERLHDGHPSGIAQELAVSTKILKIWQNQLKGAMT